MCSVGHRPSEIRLCGAKRAWFHHGVPRRLIHVLTGCTAVGKTELALRWAAARPAEIVSCDSLLFYRGARTSAPAKPTAAERARVPHHLIDICDLTERMDVTRFVVRARAAIEDILGPGAGGARHRGKWILPEGVFCPRGR